MISSGALARNFSSLSLAESRAWLASSSVTPPSSLVRSYPHVLEAGQREGQDPTSSTMATSSSDPPVWVVPMVSGSNLARVAIVEDSDSIGACLSEVDTATARLRQMNPEPGAKDLASAGSVAAFSWRRQNRRLPECPRY